MLKVVIDANVFISALLNPGKPRDVFLALKQDAFRVFYPPQLIKELAKAPSSSKLSDRIAVEDIVSLMRLVGHKATMIMVTDDNPYLACAADANCDYLVSGDKDLLDLVKFEQIKIVNPAEFLAVLFKLP